MLSVFLDKKLPTNRSIYILTKDDSDFKAALNREHRLLKEVQETLESSQLPSSPSKETGLARTISSIEPKKLQSLLTAYRQLHHEDLFDFLDQKREDTAFAVTLWANPPPTQRGKGTFLGSVWVWTAMCPSTAKKPLYEILLMGGIRKSLFLQLGIRTNPRLLSKCPDCFLPNSKGISQDLFRGFYSYSLLLSKQREMRNLPPVKWLGVGDLPFHDMQQILFHKLGFVRLSIDELKYIVHSKKIVDYEKVFHTQDGVVDFTEFKNKKVVLKASKEYSEQKINLPLFKKKLEDQEALQDYMEADGNWGIRLVSVPATMKVQIFVDPLTLNKLFMRASTRW